MLMPRKIQFSTHCPNGHAVDVVFDDRKRLKTSLDTPRSDYWCSRCTQFWPMSPADKEQLRKRLEEAESEKAR
jgi:hypothetical protein